MQESQTLPPAEAWLGLHAERPINRTIMRTKRQVSAKTWRFCLFCFVNQPNPQKEGGSTMTTRVHTTECPECAAAVPLAEAVFLHEIVVCPECGVELEVVALDPPTLDLAPEVEEDWGE